MKFGKNILKVLQKILPKILLRPRYLAKKLFDEVEDDGRFLGYKQTLDKQIINIRNTVISNPKVTTLEEIVFSNKDIGTIEDCKYSVFLYGKGGAGKTHQFFKLIDEILYGKNQNGKKKYKKIIPYYLSLNSVTKPEKDNGNAVIISLAERMKISLQYLEKIFKHKGTRAIIFADGMNEIKDGKIKHKIADDICDIRAKYKTRIILSSREDHSDLFHSLGRGFNQVFIKAEICDLTEAQIDSYFISCGVLARYKDISESTRKLLLTAQGLSMYTEMIKDDPNNILDFKNLGELIQSYCHRILGTGINKDEDIEIEKLLCSVSYDMVLNGAFCLSDAIVTKKYGEIKEYSQIANIFAKRVRGVEINYEFSHQNFRDYYAGLCLAKRINMINQNNVEDVKIKCLCNNNLTSDNEILALCSDFISLSKIQEIIDYIKSIKLEDYSFSLSILIKLYAFANNNDISTLNLDNLNLKEVSLSTYKLYSKNKNGCSVSLQHAKICENTFLQNGLQTASSNICRYKYNGKTYICAFSATNALIYDAKENTWNCIRGLPNFGWINCCCVTELYGHPCVLLGYRSDKVGVFNPSNNRVEFLFETNAKSHAGIEGVFCVMSVDNTEKIICSDTNGNVFMRNKYGANSLVLKKIHSFSTQIKQTIKKAYEQTNIPYAGRLTVSDNYIYLSYGCEILRCVLPLDKKPKFVLFKRFNENTIVRDILYSDGLLFINTGKKISVIDCNDINAGSMPFELESNSKLHYFTKFSPTNETHTVITGVCAVADDYSSLKNFYRITVDYDSKNNIYSCKGEGICGLQTLATHMGVFFRDPNSHCYRIATVSDDRSVQIIAPNEKDYETILHKGSYDGVHSIDVISRDEVLIAQYDGSVSYWRKNKSGEWLCSDVFHIHNGWVWKVQHYKKGDGSHFISCSYDGTLKSVNIETGEKTTLINVNPSQTRKPILDFTIIYDVNGDVNSIVAITEQMLYNWKGETTVPEEYLISFGENNIKDNVKSYILRSVSTFNHDKPYVAIKAENIDGTEQCYVGTIDDGVFNREIQAEDTCGFIRCLKIFKIHGKNLMVIGGNFGKMQYFGFYLYDGTSWQYKGSSKPSSFDYSTEFILDNGERIDLRADNLSPSYGPINDIAIEELSVIGAHQLNFMIYVAYKDGNIVKYEVTIGMDKTVIERIYEKNIGSQPMCVTTTKEEVFIGKLNGEVMIMDKNYNEIDVIHTYANLNSSIAVKLKNADFDSADKKDEFQKRFKGYFDFTH